MSRLSSDPVGETGTTGKLGFNYLIEFMQTENRTKKRRSKDHPFCFLAGVETRSSESRRLRERVVPPATGSRPGQVRSYGRFCEIVDFDYQRTAHATTIEQPVDETRLGRHSDFS